MVTSWRRKKTAEALVEVKAKSLANDLWGRMGRTGMMLMIRM